MTSQKLVVYKNGDFAIGEFDDENKRQGVVVYQSTKGTVSSLFQGLSSKGHSTRTSDKEQATSTSTSTTSSTVATCRMRRTGTGSSYLITIR